MNGLLRHGLFAVLSLLMLAHTAWGQPLMLPTQAATQAIEHALQDETFTALESSQRIGLVHDFVYRFKNLNADVIDDTLESNDEQARINAWSDFKQDVSEVLVLYQLARPVLLANVQLELRDEAANLNKGELYNLFFFTKRHQQKNQPFSGLLAYTSDDGVAFGVAAVQPDWLDDAVVQQALMMEEELKVLREKHRYYLQTQQLEQQAKRQDKVKAARKEKRKMQQAIQGRVDTGTFAPISETALTQVQPALTQAIAAATDDTLPSKQRIKLVHDFVQACKHIDDLGLGSAEALTWEVSIQLAKKKDFELQLQNIVAQYQSVKPVLLQNIKLQRGDEAVQLNVGDMLSVFYSHRRNYHTGKPISGLLRHQSKKSLGWLESKTIDAGVLVQFPELEQSDMIQAAIQLETEFAALLQQHQDYLQN